MPTVPSEPGVGRKGWKVVLEVVVVLLLASTLIGWFAVTRNQTGSGSFLPSKQELLRRMAEKPAVSLTETQKQTLLNAMVNPAPVTTSETKIVNGKKTVVKTTVQPTPAPTLTSAQRADLLKQMAEGK